MSDSTWQPGSTGGSLSIGSTWMPTTTTTGYNCGHCGVWVNGYNRHYCQSSYYTFYSTISLPQISSFKGSVKNLDDLPADARKGDAFYIEKLEALVVRDNGGWFHYDKS